MVYDAELFAKRLRMARGKAGLTQAELARRSGLHSLTITAYESGRTVPREMHFARLVEELGVPYEWLAGVPGADAS